eukprot:5875609-Prymnesium_polylepis.2
MACALLWGVPFEMGCTRLCFVGVLFASQRRRLFEHERYLAVRLMGLLTMYCYEEAPASGAASQGTRRTGLTQGTGAGTVKTDHVSGVAPQHTPTARVLCLPCPCAIPCPCERCPLPPPGRRPNVAF